jgi:hypothetical protein
MCALPPTLWTAQYKTTVNANSPTVVGEADSPTGDWKVSGWFTQGEKLIFAIKEGGNWAMYADETLPEMPSTTTFLPVDLSIIDPRNETINFTVFFEEVQSEQAVNPLLDFFGGNLTSNDGGLTMLPQNIWASENQTVIYNPVGGIVNYNGYYTAIISKNFGTNEPPLYLRLEEQTTKTVSPYLFVVPIGAAIMVFGVVLSVWTGKQPKQKTRRKSHGSK